MLFTAHSLPERILADGDPYPEEVRATMEAVTGRLPGRKDSRRRSPFRARAARPSRGSARKWNRPSTPWPPTACRGW